MRLASLVLLSIACSSPPMVQRVDVTGGTGGQAGDAGSASAGDTADAGAPTGGSSGSLSGRGGGTAGSGGAVSGAGGAGAGSSGQGGASGSGSGGGTQGGASGAVQGGSSGSSGAGSGGASEANCCLFACNQAGSGGNCDDGRVWREERFCATEPEPSCLECSSSAFGNRSMDCDDDPTDCETPGFNVPDGYRDCAYLEMYGNVYPPP